MLSLNALAYFVPASEAMGCGYSAWNIGIMRGNVAVLAGVSHFIPIISAGLAALLLDASLSSSFCTGAFCVRRFGTVLACDANARPRSSASARGAMHVKVARFFVGLPAGRRAANTGLLMPNRQPFCLQAGHDFA
ncbi:hypothetical protein [Burkholderia multivorans]|uniref:hypothetical protein n=1 Tax=Burkholderia multivorans TaxID=87883 RepID=UPI0030C7C932